MMEIKTIRLKVLQLVQHLQPVQSVLRLFKHRASQNNCACQGFIQEFMLEGCCGIWAILRFIRKQALYQVNETHDLWQLVVIFELEFSFNDIFDELVRIGAVIGHLTKK